MATRWQEKVPRNPGGEGVTYFKSDHSASLAEDFGDGVTYLKTDASIVKNFASLAVVEHLKEEVGLCWSATDFSIVSSVLEGELLAIRLALSKAHERNL
ncbi:hypothetical protein CsatB_002435 [Cannabis sativa]